MPIRADLRWCYRGDWPAISRRIRTERAKNRCEWCGVENGRYIIRLGGGAFDYVDEDFGGCGECDGPKVTRVVLTVAHLDHDPRPPHLDTNLAALCQRCHLLHDRDQHAASRGRTRRERERATGQLELFTNDQD